VVAVNELLEMLAGGDLRSDGKANEVADMIIRNPRRLPQLIEGLDEANDLIRGRTAHSLERISRRNAEMLKPIASRLIKAATTDKVPMVKWHIAMMLGNMEFPKEEIDRVLPSLYLLLEDESVFVKSWAMVSLVFWGRRIKGRRSEIAAKIRAFGNDKSIAIRTRVAKALRILENDNEPIPASWIKTD
jgi:hypothetical protein